MDLGQRIKQAREEAGLSQRQLCGETITRNMLSRIEHGTVRPSMSTLAFLAEKLGRPVSYFLDETTVTSPNVQRMANARECYMAGAYAGALEQLDGCRLPDDTFEWEMDLLRTRCLLELAAAALEEGRLPYAAELLAGAEEAGRKTPYCGQELERERLLLLGQVNGEADLPADDRELLLRGGMALAAGEPLRAAAYLEAAEDHTAAEWNFLRGEAWLRLKNYREAAECYQLAEKRYPREVAGRLEECFRYLEDFKMAYYYACKQRE